MPFKVTMFMTSAEQSWTEAHYYRLGSQPGDAVEPAKTLAGYRSALLGRFAYMTALRISSFPANRLVFDIALDSPYETGNWPNDPSGNTWSADQPNACLYVRMWGGNNGKNVMLAGIPDSVIQVGPGLPDDYTLPSVFNGALQKYFNFLCSGGTANPWGFRTRYAQFTTQVIGLISNALYPQAIGLQTAEPLAILTPLAGDAKAGDEVYVAGWRRKNTRVPGLQGTYQISGVLNPPAAPAPQVWTYFLYGTGNVDPGNFTGLGQITGSDYVITPYDRWEPNRAGTRKRGGSAGRRRGRSRTRR